MTRDRQFPLGAAVTIEELDDAPHPVLARLRASEPVTWLPCLDGWLITRHDLATAAMSDASLFTVDDDRFSTSQVIGPSMLSRDGPEHDRHRAPFSGPFRSRAVNERFGPVVEAEATRLIDGVLAGGAMELRRQFAGPLAAAVIARALGLARAETDKLLGCYDAIVSSVNSITAGRGPAMDGAAAFTALRMRLQGTIRAGGDENLLAGAAAGVTESSELSDDEVASNAAVLLFGGIETTEGMICNAVLGLLRQPSLIQRVRADRSLLDAVIEESLRLEPPAAMVDRYATSDCRLGGASIARGDLLHISITAANRDPVVFVDPDQFDPHRPHLRRHLAFAQGPHVCLGVHLARLEARAALGMLIERLPALRLAPGRAAEVRGLVFRKPRELRVLWG